MENFDCTTIKLDFRPTGQFAKNLMLKVLEFLLWNRQQIPFSFEKLENLMNEQNDNSYKSKGQLRKARTAYESILAVRQVRHILNLAVLKLHVNSFLQIIESEFFNAKSFLIVFGSSIITAKEAYQVKFPTITSCQHPFYMNEAAMLHKIILKLIQAESFKCLFTSPLSITNSFILFERYDDDGLTDGLSRIRNFKLNKSCKKYAIKFRDSSDFDIFCEEIEELKLCDIGCEEADEREEDIWYQSRVFIKGFHKAVASSL